MEAIGNVTVIEFLENGAQESSEMNFSEGDECLLENLHTWRIKITTLSIRPGRNLLQTTQHSVYHRCFIPLVFSCGVYHESRNIAAAFSSWKTCGKTVHEIPAYFSCTGQWFIVMYLIRI